MIHLLKIDGFTGKTMEQLDTSADLTTSFDRNAIKFGFTLQAELWNRRLAMLGVVILMTAILLKQNILHL